MQKRTNGGTLLAAGRNWWVFEAHQKKADTLSKAERENRRKARLNRAMAQCLRMDWDGNFETVALNYLAAFCDVLPVVSKDVDTDFEELDKLKAIPGLLTLPSADCRSATLIAGNSRIKAFGKDEIRDFADTARLLLNLEGVARGYLGPESLFYVERPFGPARDNWTEYKGVCALFVPKAVANALENTVVFTSRGFLDSPRNDLGIRIRKSGKKNYLQISDMGKRGQFGLLPMKDVAKTLFAGICTRLSPHDVTWQDWCPIPARGGGKDLIGTFVDFLLEQEVEQCAMCHKPVIRMRKGEGAFCPPLTSDPNRSQNSSSCYKKYRLQAKRFYRLNNENARATHKKFAQIPVETIESWKSF